MHPVVIRTIILRYVIVIWILRWVCLFARCIKYIRHSPRMTIFDGKNVGFCVVEKAGNDVVCFSISEMIRLEAARRARILSAVVVSLNLSFWYGSSSCRNDCGMIVYVSAQHARLHHSTLTRNKPLDHLRTFLLLWLLLYYWMHSNL